MAWVRFTRDYSFVPKEMQQISIAYKSGSVKFVTTECEARAIAACAAVKAKRPRSEPVAASADQ
jgi:hypothetical protein